MKRSPITPTELGDAMRGRRPEVDAAPITPGEVVETPEGLGILIECGLYYCEVEFRNGESYRWVDLPRSQVKVATPATIRGTAR